MLGGKIKRLLSILMIVALSSIGISSSASDGFTYTNIGAPSLAPGGLTVTVNSLQLVEKTGSVQLVVNYTQKNNSLDKKLDEGSFKLFFTDGTSEPQYGGFNSFFPGDGNTRSYTWEWLKGKEPWLIEWEAGFFAAKPTSSGLKWKVGSAYPSTGSGEPAGSRVREILTSAPTSTLPGKTLIISFTLLDAQGKSVPNEKARLTGTGPGFFVNVGEQTANGQGVIEARVLLLSSDLGEVSVTLAIGELKKTVTVLVANPSTTPATSSPSVKAPKPVKYKNCSALQKVYPQGVARSAKWVNKGGGIKLIPVINSKVYDLNTTLDRDKDGIACER